MPEAPDSNVIRDEFEVPMAVCGEVLSTVIYARRADETPVWTTYVDGTLPEPFVDIPENELAKIEIDWDQKKITYK